MRLPKCSVCEKEERRKFLKKIKGKLYCLKCYREIRLNHRDETIKQSGIANGLSDFKKQDKRIYAKEHREEIKIYNRKRYHRENPNAKYYTKDKRILEINIPKIKGTKTDIKIKSSSYIDFEEKKRLLGILVKKGMDFDLAKLRLNNLVNQLAKTRKQLKEGTKTKQEALRIKENLIRDLCNY